MVNLGPTVNIDRDPRWGRSFEAFTRGPIPQRQDGRVRRSTGCRARMRCPRSNTSRSTTRRPTATPRPTTRSSVSARCTRSPPGILGRDPAGQSARRRLQHECNRIREPDRVPDGADAISSGKFHGIMTSDYQATDSTVQSATRARTGDACAAVYGSALQAAVESGQVSMDTLNQMVRRILGEMFRFNESQPAHGVDQRTRHDRGQSGDFHRGRRGGHRAAQERPTHTATALDRQAPDRRDWRGGLGRSHRHRWRQRLRHLNLHVTPLQGIQSAAPAGTPVHTCRGSD